MMGLCHDLPTASFFSLNSHFLPNEGGRVARVPLSPEFSNLSQNYDTRRPRDKKILGVGTLQIHSFELRESWIAAMNWVWKHLRYKVGCTRTFADFHQTILVKRFSSTSSSTVFSGNENHLTQRLAVLYKPAKYDSTCPKILSTDFYVCMYFHWFKKDKINK